QGLLPAWLTGAMPTGFENAAPPDLVIFSSFEADDFSRYGGAGFKWRPSFVDKETGFAVIAAAGHAQWRDQRINAAGLEETVPTTRGSLLIGRDFRIGTGILGLYGGIEYIRETAFDPFSDLLRRSSRAGARVQIDWWQRPSERSLFTLNVSAGTAKREVWARAAYGYDLFGFGFIGPELAVSASRKDTIWRGGLHISEIPLRGLKLRIAAGAAHQRGRTGAYLSIANYYRF
ncbi:MAG: cellulose biosynthesis protein BcsS, partial [Beijerinckiaceae bacterium]